MPDQQPKHTRTHARTPRIYKVSVVIKTKLTLGAASLGTEAGTYTLYSQPLSDLICRHECDYHKYADDTQLSKGVPPDQFQSLLCDIQTCIESLVGWMYRNKLKLNAEKTEVLPVASTSRLSLVGRDSVDIGGKRIPFRSSVRNLGVHLD